MFPALRALWALRARFSCSAAPHAGKTSAARSGPVPVHAAAAPGALRRVSALRADADSRPEVLREQRRAAPAPQAARNRSDPPRWLRACEAPAAEVCSYGGWSLLLRRNSPRRQGGGGGAPPGTAATHYSSRTCHHGGAKLVLLVPEEPEPSDERLLSLPFGSHSNMETELFMECEEEELEPWQQVDDSVEEEDVDFVDSCDPGEQLQHRSLLLQELKSGPSSRE